MESVSNSCRQNAVNQGKLNGFKGCSKNGSWRKKCSRYEQHCEGNTKVQNADLSELLKSQDLSDGKCGPRVSDNKHICQSRKMGNGADIKCNFGKSNLSSRSLCTELPCTEKILGSSISDFPDKSTSLFNGVYNNPSELNRLSINEKVQWRRNQKSCEYGEGINLSHNKESRDNRNGAYENYFPVNVRYNRSGRNNNFIQNHPNMRVPYNNSRFRDLQKSKDFTRNTGSLDFHNCNTYKSRHFQSSNKIVGSQQSDKFSNNGSTAEINSPDSPKSNNHQRTFVFKRSGKNGSKNPLGIYWPRLNPFIEGESVSGESGDKLTPTKECKVGDNKINNLAVTKKRNRTTSTPPSKEVMGTLNDLSNLSTGSSDVISPYISSTDNKTDETSDTNSEQIYSVICKSEKSSNPSRTIIIPENNDSDCNFTDQTKKCTNDNVGKSSYKCDTNHLNKPANSLPGVGETHKPGTQASSVHCCDEKMRANQSKPGGAGCETDARNQSQPNGSKARDVGHSNPSKEKQGKISDLRKSPSHNNPTKKKKKKSPDVRTYCIKLNLKDSFNEQAAFMISQFEMTAHEKAKVDLLKIDLNRVFAPLLPNVQSILFGSVVAGTAFKTSDVDVYLECYNSLPMGNVREFILRYGSAIHKGGYFRHCIKIANARVPILKAIHNSTGMNVDISFVTDQSENHYGLSNSLLVKHLCSRDPRVRSLIMLVLFWAKSHGFVGKYQMSSFTFILMAIFYLQIVEILPPLHKLIQVNTDSTSWPNTFNIDTRLLENNNTETLQSLFHGFFIFYSAVRFDEVVISVYAGELILSVLFESMETLPQCFSGYKKLVETGLEPALERSDMCIQEPFNMSWNTVRSVNVKIIELLKQSCHNVFNVFSKFSPNRILSVVNSDYQHSKGDDDSYSWEIPCPSDFDSKDWFKKILKATETIFRAILLMEIHEGYFETDDSKFCLFNLSDTEDVNPVRLIVSSEYMIAGKERSKLVKSYKSKYRSELETEVKASMFLLDTLKKKETPHKFSATLYIARNEKNNSTEVSVNKCTLHNKWRKCEHKQFVSFLKNDYFKQFLKLILEHDQTNKSDENSLTQSD